MELFHLTKRPAVILSGQYYAPAIGSSLIALGNSNIDVNEKMVIKLETLRDVP